MLSTSLKTQPDIFATPPRLIPSPPTFAAYRAAVLDNPTVLHAIVSSFVIGIGTTALTLDGKPVAVAPDGSFIIGFGRDATAATLSATIIWRTASRRTTATPSPVTSTTPG